MVAFRLVVRQLSGRMDGRVMASGQDRSSASSTRSFTSGYIRRVVDDELDVLLPQLPDVLLPQLPDLLLDGPTVSRSFRSPWSPHRARADDPPIPAPMIGAT